MLGCMSGSNQQHHWWHTGLHACRFLQLIGCVLAGVFSDCWLVMLMRLPTLEHTVFGKHTLYMRASCRCVTFTGKV